MPAFLLIGIPIAVAVLLFGILSLPDDEPKEEETEVDKKSDKSQTKKKKK